MVIVVVAAVVVTGAVVTARRIDRTLPGAAVRTDLPASATVAGTAPSLPWPTTGQAAVSVPALGYRARSGPDVPVPIASLTKMATALVVLHDHPVAGDGGGPAITVTAVDFQAYEYDLSHDQSTVPVETGEVLTERQMLEALLAESANNIAYALAAWDAGSQEAFVAKMNALATVLGADHTHFVDASGVDPRSVSTAGDCLRVAVAALADPTFAQVAALPTVTIPLVGTVPNEVSEIGSRGVVGVKSGYTSEAGACMVLAADRMVGGRKVLVLVAVLGQPVPPAVTLPTTGTPASAAGTTTTTTTTTVPPPPGTPPPPTSPTTTPTTPTTAPPPKSYVPDPFQFARPTTDRLLAATEAAVRPVTVAAPGRVVGDASVAWGGTEHEVPVDTSVTARLAAWPGQVVGATVRVRPVPADGRRGDVVGTVEFSVGSEHVTVPIRLADAVPEPTWWWRVTHR